MPPRGPLEPTTSDLATQIDIWITLSALLLLMLMNLALTANRTAQGRELSSPLLLTVTGEVGTALQCWWKPAVAGSSRNCPGEGH